MITSRTLISFALAICALITQTGVVFATPPATLLMGTVQSITLETDVNTAVTTVLFTIVDANNARQTVRVSQITALSLRLITTNDNGMPVINPKALGMMVQIDPAVSIAENEADLHPVGDALATFFSEITDYETIMAARAEGIGFGVIAQTLWMTQILSEDFEMDTSELFAAILEAKSTGDYTAFELGDGSTPNNWGQFRKAVLDGHKKGNLGIVMANKDEEESNGSGVNGAGNGNGQGSGNGNGQGNNNGNGQDNNNGNGNGNGQGHGNNK
jgi:hypothetical protein